MILVASTAVPQQPIVNHICLIWLFKRQPHKVVKHTQTIRRQIADELFEYVWPFLGVGAKRVNPFQ